MASSRKRALALSSKKVDAGGLAGRKAATGVVKAEHKRKVTRRKSAEATDHSERNDPYPIKPRK